MKKTSILFVAGLACTLASGCKDPSKADVCGGCSGTLKQACEEAYDLCDANSACDLDDLEDSSACKK